MKVESFEKNGCLEKKNEGPTKKLKLITNILTKLAWLL